MEIQGYRFCDPEALPKKKKTGIARTFALVGLVVLSGGLDSAEAADSDKHKDHLFDISYSIDNLCSIQSQSEETSHIERDIILSELDRIVNELNSQGWDGYGAYPIFKQAYLNAVDIVKKTPESILKLWNVFPAPNGTISFEFKEREVAIMSVGIDGFSFAAAKDDEDPIMGEMDFDPIKASEALIEMSELFGYHNV